MCSSDLVGRGVRGGTTTGLGACRYFTQPTSPSTQTSSVCHSSVAADHTRTTSVGRAFPGWRSRSITARYPSVVTTRGFSAVVHHTLSLVPIALPL